MVTCKVDSVPVSKMNSVCVHKPSGNSSNSSGFRLLDNDHLETSSSVSRNSVYKLKIDLMFDDSSRSIKSQQLDDPHGSRRTRSIIMYGRSELASTNGESSRSVTSYLRESNETRKFNTPDTKNDVQRISNSVQAQIEQLFTDVAKDASSSFAVTCLGSLPLKDKVTSLQGLQAPLRELYLQDANNEKRQSGFLDICATGLRVKTNSNASSSAQNEENITPFHNIAVWSAVKFVLSDEDGGAAFLPLITSSENIDKTTLFQPLSAAEHKHLASNTHAPIFAVVMRSAHTSKVLECHAFICQSTDDAIVIAATLYQSLMAHVSSSSQRSTKRRAPKNRNGVSCMSIASSSAITGSQYLTHSQAITHGRKSSVCSSSGSLSGAAVPQRSVRKKRSSGSSQTGSAQTTPRAPQTSSDERKRRSHKTKRAPPVPTTSPSHVHNSLSYGKSHDGSARSVSSHTVHNSQRGNYNALASISSQMAANKSLKTTNTTSSGHIRNETNGDILTRVAIPRSGSFLNTGGLTRYKSRVARRNSGKLGGIGGGGGGGSPLGFSELFNEFRLHENLNSLDEILYAIIDADGMSFNDLKPIYKEFLLKLAVTLTKDELFQRSKNIMRRQKKKKSKRKQSSTTSQKKPKTLIFGSKSLKKVFQLGQFRSCRGKPRKPPRSKELHIDKKDITGPLPLHPTTNGQLHQQRSRVATSGSDVSVVRNDNAFMGLNRNSSSGYVSCSECSYDSETCTCTSADRCYCSLRTDHANHKMRRKQDGNQSNANRRSARNSNEKNSYKANGNNGSSNRQSLISCKSDEKCYCSLAEEDQTPVVEDDSHNTVSDTTYCDTDSCISTSKCYCKRAESRNKNHQAIKQAREPKHKPKDKFGLDYELFTIGGNGKSVQPHEALSMKKSVEAAAIFADVKLSQTTDIKSLYGAAMKAHKEQINNNSVRSVYTTQKQIQAYRKRECISVDRKNERNAVMSLSSSSSQRSCSADDLLTKLTAIERAVEYAASVKSNANKRNEQLIINKYGLRENYQSMRAVSASLEDTLGYLP